jgi:SAM-dependent methyltransferase
MAAQPSGVRALEEPWQGASRGAAAGAVLGEAVVGLVDDGVVEREREFWDQHVPSLDQLVKRSERGAVGSTAALLDAVEPLRGRRVLDFACGAGETSVFLAQRGARVTAVDLSRESIARGHELAEQTGQEIEFIAGELGPGSFAPGGFDVVIGRYALHHVHLPTMAPILSAVLARGGRGAFLETMGLNPLLNFSRRFAGHAGVASYGSEDERPIDRADLRVLRGAFDSVELDVAQMRFLRILNRNVLRNRHRRAARALGSVDDTMLRLGLGFLSYTQIVKVANRP